MDRYSGKRGSGAKKERFLALKKPTSEGNSNSQNFNRTGCKGRVHSSQATRIGSPDKAKSSPYVHSSKGKEIIESSRSSRPVTINWKTSNLNSTREVPSPLEFGKSESYASGESEASNSLSLPRINPTRYQLEPAKWSGKFFTSEIGSSSVSSNIKPRKVFQPKRQGSHDQNFLPGPTPTLPSVSKSTKLGTCICDDGIRYGQRGFKCNNMPDVAPRNCVENVMKKKTSEGINSSDCRGRKTTAALCINGNMIPSTSGTAISGSRHTTAFGSRNYNSRVTSVQSQRLMNTNIGMRLSCQNDGRNNLSLRGPEASFSRYPHTEIPSNVGNRTTSANASLNGSSSCSILSNSDNTSFVVPCTSPELSYNNLSNNMDGFVEVLLALERMEQDEELTHERLLSLELSLFLGGLNLHDQHRDMRMDVDNMSYEELLALEDRMGVVSTALSEEELSKCISRSIFQATPAGIRATGLGEDGDDIRCSICQEDYEDGNEIGKFVECQHGYHLACINQWLGLKNWCPICKSSAAAPTRPSSSLRKLKNHL